MALFRVTPRTQEREVGDEPWGQQALFQLIALLIVGALLWGALQQVHDPANTREQPRAWLLTVHEWIANEILPSLDRALSPNYVLRPLDLPRGVAVWALVSIIGNLISAAILLFMSARSWRRDRPLVKTMGIVISVLGIVVSLAVVPFLFAVLIGPSGRHLPFDAAVVSVVIFSTYLIVDLLLAVDATVRVTRRAFLVFVAALDLPCLLTTGLFISCSIYVALPPEFAIGVSAALFTYYSLAFVLLGGLLWFSTRNGEALMKTLRGRKATAIAVGAALNGAIGIVVQWVKLPVYLDLVGSIYVALVFGPVPGILSAVLGNIIIGVLTNPIFIAYVGTAVGVTVAAAYLKRKTRFGRALLPTVLWGGLVLGPLSSLLSIPITTYLFSGVTFAGSDAVTALFLNTMKTTLLQSVALGALSFDLIDKALSSLLAYWLLVATPRRILSDTDDD